LRPLRLPAGTCLGTRLALHVRGHGCEDKDPGHEPGGDRWRLAGGTATKVIDDHLGRLADLSTGRIGVCLSFDSPTAAAAGRRALRQGEPRNLAVICMIT
jgi:hypothetical protein